MRPRLVKSPTYSSNEMRNFSEDVIRGLVPGVTGAYNEIQKNDNSELSVPTTAVAATESTWFTVISNDIIGEGGQISIQWIGAVCRATPATGNNLFLAFRFSRSGGAFTYLHDDAGAPLVGTMKTHLPVEEVTQSWRETLTIDRGAVYKIQARAYHATAPGVATILANTHFFIAGNIREVV